MCPFDDKDYVIQWASKNGNDEVVKLFLSDERVRSICK
jgi:hypothetical protein